MVVIKIFTTNEYIDAEGNLVADINEAFRFDSVEQATRYAVHAGLKAIEYETV